MSDKKKKIKIENKNRIALITPLARQYGSWRFKLLKDLRERNVEIHALGGNYQKETKNILSSIGVIPVDIELENNRTKLFKELRSIIEITRLFRKNKYDIILAFGIKPTIYATIASIIAGIRNCNCMITGLGMMFTKNEKEGNIRIALLQMTIKLLLNITICFNKKVIFQNRDDMELFKSLRITRNEQAAIVNGSGIDLEKYKYSDVDNRNITYFMASRLIKQKGVLEFLQSASEIRKQHPKVKFVIAGDYWKNTNKKQKEEIELKINEGDVEWLGWVKDVQTIYEHSSVYVLPSYYREGVPHSILEALAVGRPVITTDAPGCRETVKKLADEEFKSNIEAQKYWREYNTIMGKNGFLIPPRNAESLVEAMKYFIENKDKTKEMGVESRKLAEEKFDVNKVNEDIMRIIGL